MQIEQLNEIRKERGLQIANTSRIMKRERGGYIVPSQSGAGAYIVSYNSATFKPECECEDFGKRSILGVKCKHIRAVELTLNKQVNLDGTTTVTKTVKVTYPQDWHAYNQAQTKETELFMKLLHDLTKGISKPYIFGRKPLNLCEVIFCSALKVYSTLSSRRTVMNYKTALENGYITHKPHFNAVSKLLNKKDLTDILLRLIMNSSLPLKAVEKDFAIDSTGFSVSRYGRWFNFRCRKDESHRNWLKAHVMVGVKTGIITSVQITEGVTADSPLLPQLLEKTTQNFTVQELSADKGYSSKSNLDAVNRIGGVAYIPFKKNTTGVADGSMFWSKMFHYFMYNREEFLQHYHKRSNVEAVFHMIKSKFGSNVRSKNEISQINELLLKILCHNICVVIQEMHELGISADFTYQAK